MIELSLRVVESLRNGVRRREENSLNSPFLTGVRGLKPTERGLSRVDIFERQTPNGVWPFPQVIKGSKHLFLLSEGGIAIVEDTLTSLSGSETGFTGVSVASW